MRLSETESVAKRRSSASARSSSNSSGRTSSRSSAADVSRAAQQGAWGSAQDVTGGRPPSPSTTSSGVPFWSRSLIVMSTLPSPLVSNWNRSALPSPSVSIAPEVRLAVVVRVADEQLHALVAARLDGLVLAHQRVLSPLRGNPVHRRPCTRDTRAQTPGSYALTPDVIRALIARADSSKPISRIAVAWKFLTCAAIGLKIFGPSVLRRRCPWPRTSGSACWPA